MNLSLAFMIHDNCIYACNVRAKKKKKKTGFNIDVSKTQHNQVKSAVWFDTGSTDRKLLEDGLKIVSLLAGVSEVL